MVSGYFCGHIDKVIPLLSCSFLIRVVLQNLRIILGCSVDPFTSSREGVVEDDERFRSLMHYLKQELLSQVIDDWDKFRLEVKEEGDDENKRKSKRERKAQALVTEATNDYKPDDDAPARDDVDKWLKEITPDAEFNTSAYVDCRFFRRWP